jgi:ATP/ADP translocase
MNKLATGTIEAGTVMIMTIAVFFATILSLLASTPDCMLNHRGFGAAGIPFLGAVLAAPCFLMVTMSRRRKSPETTLSLRMKRHGLVALAVVVVFFAVHFLLCGPVMHLGEHDCKLIPWSP